MSHQSSISKPLIVGISGASGIIYGIRLLEILKELNIATHLVISTAAKRTLLLETDFSVAEVEALATVSYDYRDIAAAIASGSYQTAGMIIAPCSIRTMSEIAAGTTASLLTRAADVILKERRQLVLMLRETPLHTNHLRHLLELSQAGAIVAPVVPAFYTKPTTLEDIINHTVGRVLDLFSIEFPDLPRWPMAL